MANSKAGQGWGRLRSSEIVEEEPDFTIDENEFDGDDDNDSGIFANDPQFLYNKRSDYPKGRSKNYLGNRIGNRSSFPELRCVKRIRKRLGQIDQRIYNGLVADIKACYRIKRHDNPGIKLTKTNAPERWVELLKMVAKSPNRPPIVRKALNRLAFDEWDQLKRYVWHALDNLVMILTKHCEEMVLESQKAMDEFLNKNPSWIG